jgi:hypothetical protein
MSNLVRSHAILCGAIAFTLAVSAQSSTTEKRSGTVVYVSGNDLVVKMDDGQVKHFSVPAGAVFHVDGKDLTVHELKAGTHLSQTITTTETPSTVRTVRTVQGKVWNVNPPTSVILTLPDGTNKQYKVPEGTKFDVDGQESTVFDLRKGMNITATVVTEAPEVTVSRSNVVTGRAPAPPPKVAVTPPPATPPQKGVLLIVVEPTPVAAAPAPTPVATPSPAPPQEQTPAPEPSHAKRLPHSASSLPLIGLLGLLVFMVGLGMNVLARGTRRLE